jgi:hypothetical protein
VRRSIVVGVVGAVATVVALAGAAGAYPLPWDRAASAADDPLNPQRLMNADNARRILDAPDAGEFALPTQVPAGLHFLFTVRTTASAFEIAVQHGTGVQFVLCDGDADPGSACDAPSVHVVRDELVDGRRVRVGQVDLAATGDEHKVGTPSAQEAAEALDFWRTAELVRGTPPWVSALAQR